MILFNGVLIVLTLLGYKWTQLKETINCYICAISFARNYQSPYNTKEKTFFFFFFFSSKQLVIEKDWTLKNHKILPFDSQAERWEQNKQQG